MGIVQTNIGRFHGELPQKHNFRLGILIVLTDREKVDIDSCRGEVRICFVVKCLSY